MPRFWLQVFDLWLIRLIKFIIDSFGEYFNSTNPVYCSVLSQDSLNTLGNEAERELVYERRGAPPPTRHYWSSSGTPADRSGESMGRHWMYCVRYHVAGRPHKRILSTPTSRTSCKDGVRQCSQRNRRAVFIHRFLSFLSFNCAAPCSWNLIRNADTDDGQQEVAKLDLR